MKGGVYRMLTFNVVSLRELYLLKADKQNENYLD